MKKIFFILLVFFFVESLQGQEDIKKVNFIITVDEKLAVDNILNSNIFIKSGDKIDTISCRYLPGELIIYDYSKLVSADSNMVVLSIWYIKRRSNKYYYYKIELNKNLFINYSYVILRIYNLDKWKYRRIYYPLDGKNYTYEFELPGYSIIRIRKR